MQTLTFAQVKQMAEVDDQTGIAMHSESAPGVVYIDTAKGLVDSIYQAADECWTDIIHAFEHYSHFVLLADHEAAFAFGMLS